MAEGQDSPSNLLAFSISHDPAAFGCMSAKQMFFSLPAKVFISFLAMDRPPFGRASEKS